MTSRARLIGFNHIAVEVGDVDFPRVVCNLGSIASGDGATIKLTVRATEAATLRNRGKVSGSSSDVNTSNNRAVSEVRAR